MRMRWLERWLLSTRLRGWLLRTVEASRVLGLLRLPHEPTCLEVGCGNGIGAMVISKRLQLGRLICVNSDPDMLYRARKLLVHPPPWATDVDTSRIELVCGDATHLSLPDGHFDAVFLFGVLHHIRQWPAAISEAHRGLVMLVRHP